MALLRCAKCGRHVRKKVVYGYPCPELMEQARRGEVVLGGCEVGEPIDPWWCDHCRPARNRTAMGRISRQAPRKRL